MANAGIRHFSHGSVGIHVPGSATHCRTGLRRVGGGGGHVDNAQPHEADINYYMALTLIVYAAGTVAGLARSALLGIIGERTVARLRYALYGSILRQETAFFDDHKSGELVSRLGSDTTLLQTVVGQAVPESLVGIIKVVVSIILMFYISPKLAGVSIGGTFTLCVTAVPFGMVLSRLAKEYQDVLGHAQSYSTEAMGNMRTVQSFAAEDKELQRFGSLTGNPDTFRWWYPSASAGRTTYRIGFFKAVTQSGFYTLIFGGGFGFLYVSLWYGFYLVIQGQMTLGDLTAFQSYIFSIGFGLGQAAGNIAQLFAGLGASGRIFYLLERIPRIPKRSVDGEPPSKTLTPSTMEGSILFDNVQFAYPSRPDDLVMNGFTLKLPKNSTTALVGSSGAGKSTVVSLIQRFYDVDGGTITVDGNNVEDLDLRFLRKHIGYVQQEPQLFGLTIKQNLLYGVDDESTVTQETIEAACRDANCHDFITSWDTGYNTLVGEKGVKLSGGQKQRIAIARALLTNCRILLLDEATSALDAESEHEVQTAIERAMVGRTVVVVAHRLSTIQSADQIVVLSNHKIVDVGTHESLMKGCRKYIDLIKRQSMMTRDVSTGQLRSMLGDAGISEKLAVS